MPDPSDEQLVKAFHSGDEDAFSAFVARHQDRLHRVAFMWLQDAGLVDDAVQETLLRTYTGLSRSRFRFRARLSSFKGPTPSLPHLVVPTWGQVSLNPSATTAQELL